jgi:hypothetical protein
MNPHWNGNKDYNPLNIPCYFRIFRQTRISAIYILSLPVASNCVNYHCCLMMAICNKVHNIVLLLLHML